MSEIEKRIKETFFKIAFFRIIFLLFEFALLISIFKEKEELTLLILSTIVILLVTLFMNLWEAINKERCNNE